MYCHHDHNSDNRQNHTHNNHPDNDSNNLNMDNNNSLANRDVDDHVNTNYVDSNHPLAHGDVDDHRSISPATICRPRSAGGSGTRRRVADHIAGDRDRHDHGSRTPSSGSAAFVNTDLNNGPATGHPNSSSRSSDDGAAVGAAAVDSRGRSHSRTSTGGGATPTSGDCRPGRGSCHCRPGRRSGGVVGPGSQGCACGGAVTWLRCWRRQLRHRRSYAA
mmetsp:Transcript_133384/g.371869  ORF Transcript_133384/g.371869 Transcript_133384/m.371869 type:complete len:218 (+) Transcript_133384:784-1437(+)